MKLSQFRRFILTVAPTAFIFLVTVASISAQDDDDNENDLNVNSTTVQTPTLGISIDANGVLTAKVFADPRGELIRKRLAEAKAKLPGNLAKKSKLRKISLRKLEAEIKRLAAQGKPPTDAMNYLAGLTRANYVFVYPEKNDIVIAGPAEPWVKNASGRVVGIHSNKPTLQLEDLIAAIRTFRPSAKLNTWVACSIDPTPKGIEQLKQFQKTIPKNIPPASKARAAAEIGQGLQKSLGQAQIKVYGVPRKTHLAQVMIEADYRMKLMAVGLEPPPIKMTTFIAALRGAPRDMQRWWFSPNYDCVKVDDKNLAIELIGQGVLLSTQNIDFDKRARIVSTGKKSSPASKKYATSFTKKYPEISKVRPVYAQLRNIIDMLVLAAWIHKSKAYQKVDWTPDFFLDEKKFSIETMPDPKQCPCVANAVWKGHVLVLPAGGGVSINAARALTSKHLIKDKKGAIAKVQKEIQLGDDPQQWWWD